MILQIKFLKELWRENSCSGLYCSVNLLSFGCPCSLLVSEDGGRRFAQERYWDFLAHVTGASSMSSIDVKDDPLH